MREGWRDFAVGPDLTIQQALQRIDSGARKMAFVVDLEDRLLGTISDGDIRRAIIHSGSLNHPVHRVMNSSPLAVTAGTPRSEMLALMRSRRLDLLPIVDASQRILGFEPFGEDAILARRDNIVVLMAGGKGMRLRPLTETIPKPLLKIGDMPILEIIIRQFISQGFYRFAIAINYLGALIQQHFGDGSDLGVEIRYIEEKNALGTAGALGLIDSTQDAPIMVMNGDLLTHTPFDRLIDYHVATGGGATMALREYDFQIPFGVVTVDNGFVTSIEEKPVRKMLVNGGIYVLEPAMLDYVDRDRPLDMPDLLEIGRANGHSIATFAIRDYWLDLGRPEDFRRAELEFWASPQSCFAE